MTKLVALGMMALVAGITLADQTAINRRSTGGRFGGMVIRPGTMKGQLVIANSLNLPVESIVNKAINDFKRLFNADIVVKDFSRPSIVSATKAVDETGGQLALFLIEDTELPILLCAPESRWVMLNASPLKQGVDEDVFSKRLRIELVRGLALLSGSHSSAYNGTLVDAVQSPEDLDKMNADMTLPVDVASRFKNYLGKYGVTQGLRVQYRQAVKEGWAPAPTNQVQQAIWDKIHALPTEPMKIKPETQKVTE